ncbi:MAG TPA: nucleotidyltransferase domain-containing protein [Bryobacteraceae bacterium]|nr:nucleotidyltransferase domain-containing protein [Bryobacteraceae bacterium]
MQEIFEQFRRDPDPFQVFETRTRSVDEFVKSAAAASLAPRLTSQFAVVAVGGYGRKELFPYSDIDVVVLFENEPDVAATKEPLADFLQALWDNGLRASHSVRSVAECCRFNEHNVELHISLIDLRYVAGSTELFHNLENRLPEFYQRYAEAITHRVSELSRARHAKFNHTVYHLEPNVKESPGGIRDLHLLRWLARLLPQNEAIREAVTELDGARRFLFAVRCFLHFQSGRDYNLLTFELQDESARALPSQPEEPAAWMRTYYRNARRIYQSSGRALDQVEAHDASLLRQFRDWRSRLSTPEFTISRDRVFLRNPGETLQSVDGILRLFIFVARHGLKLSWDAQRRLRSATEAFRDELRGSAKGADARHQTAKELVKPFGGALDTTAVLREFLNSPLRWETWHELFAQPNAGAALADMQETGLLAAAIPEWESIDGLVVRDFYHRYTVDEHTLVAIGVIDDLATPKAHMPQRFQKLLEEEQDPAQVRLALLLHDLGKGTKPGDHVAGSLAAAPEILARMGAPAETIVAILFLIEHHLDLSLIMNARDPEDPATARYLTSRIDTQEALRRLALLTFADISAVNPTAMTPWRMEQLWRVYSMGSEQLTRELVTDRIDHAPALVSGESVGPELASFLQGFPMRYVRTHTRKEIEHHLALEQQSQDAGTAVEIAPLAGAYLVTVLARDRAGLFAMVCGALAGFGMNIVRAEAFGNAHGVALEVMRFTDPMRTLELNPDEVDRLRWTIERAVTRSIEVNELLKRRRASPRLSRGARILPAVRFNNDASDVSTLIDFTGEDRPGLLHDLASALAAAGCNIEVVMIDTEAHKAIDVFYVTYEGRKLDDALQERLQIELMRAATPG